MKTRLEAPPQAPDSGLLRRLLGPFYVTGVFWFRFHRWGVSILPSWSVGVFIALFTSFFFVALRRIRKAIASNLAAVLGPCGWWRRQGRIYRTLWNFAWCLSERYERLSTARRVGAWVEGVEIWEAVQQEPAGFILVTAHIGHWEVGSMFPDATRRRLHLVREEEMDPRAQRFVRGLIERAAGTNVTVHFAPAGDPTLGPLLLNALRRGEVVALQGDRPRTGGGSIEVTLLGRPCELPLGPAALARAAGVDLLPVYVFREGRHRARVVLRPPLRVAATADRAGDLRRATTALAEQVEWAIRLRPFQWFCFRELWPDGRLRSPEPQKESMTTSGR